MRRTPKTRYPWSAERFYSKQLLKLVDQLGKLTLSVFDDQIKPQIKLYKMRTDADYKTDAPLDVIRQAIELIKALSLGIFSSDDLLKTATRFMNNLNQQSKANTDSQAKVHGIDPIKSEPWLDEFMRNTVHENVSYISSIRDEYFPKIESIIYQGVKKGQSIGVIRRGLVDRVGMTRNRAQFIAIDQTGTIFGQMTGKRHQEMGVNRFEWVDAGDNRVRPKHRDLNGNTYSYGKPPSEGLPGEPFRCRCVAYPVFDD
ncbi:MAG: minor capsid protein [Sporolactobacillus sp.]